MDDVDRLVTIEVHAECAIHDADRDCAKLPNGLD